MEWAIRFFLFGTLVVYAAARVCRLFRMLGASMGVSIFVMGAFALLAWVRLSDEGLAGRGVRI